MEVTDTHVKCLSGAFERLLGQAESGALAFVRCLPEHIVAHCAATRAFAPGEWEIFRVADTADSETRTITADMAVEQREGKGVATLLLVDPGRAGAGMDGIYSAAREVDEESLFQEAQRLGLRALDGQARRYVERALSAARQAAGRHAVPPWDAFDFLARVLQSHENPGAQLRHIGLWPISDSPDMKPEEALDTSRKLVERLLGIRATGLSVPARIDAIQLEGLDGGGRAALERFLDEADALPIRDAVRRLGDRPELWVGVVRVNSERIEAIGLSSWRGTTGKVSKWSGLVQTDADAAPVLLLRPDPKSAKEYTTLEVRWRPQPSGITKGTVDYRVAVLTTMDEELAVRDVTHSARSSGERCRFTNEDFDVEEDSLISAKVVVSVPGDGNVDREESEEFVIRWGEPPEGETASGAGRKLRTFSEGLIELDDAEEVSAVLNNPLSRQFDAKRSAAVLRTLGSKRLSFQVPYPPLLREVEQQWQGADGKPGRWCVEVRMSGDHAGAVNFVEAHGGGPAWDRVRTASRRFAKSTDEPAGVVGHVSYRRAERDAAKDYILAWAAFLEADSDPELALCNTVEVQSTAGRTIGLIVLPMHPLRAAWHVSYDDLAFHAALEQGQAASDVRKELGRLDAALFPAFLPNPAGGTFVFADMLGFHGVGMVADTLKEPKAAVSVLARAWSGTGGADSAPAAGERSAALVGDEIGKYLACHTVPRVLHLHALRAGDAFTVARSLGRVQAALRGDGPTDADREADSDSGDQAGMAFSLDLYPSPEQRDVAGRYIASALERRRSGAGAVAVDDRWMQESLSLPGGVTMPRLRWAKKEEEPITAAHVAVAFDTFESSVLVDAETEPAEVRSHAFGMLSFFDREYIPGGIPVWRSGVPLMKGGEKHPAERGHTDRLARMQDALRRAVARHLGAQGGDGRLLLQTSVPPEKEDDLRKLHALCDWVVTLDRNAGIEYFDSPRDNPSIYDAYVIDCVPEREDLGSLQLVTSTTNLAEVRSLLDRALDGMGLSHSRRNAEFLLRNLKALSGRLAIRLSGTTSPAAELIALALAHANCLDATQAGPCWLPLRDGFIVPIDDVQDLLPAVKVDDGERGVRPDLLYVSTSRNGLRFCFVEVKYRRDLNAARSQSLVGAIREQVEGVRRRWERYYLDDECSIFLAIRRAKLSRVLRFYADKARRHHLAAHSHTALLEEIDRLVESGRSYTYDGQGWVFCPEYDQQVPQEISPAESSRPAVFLFGPSPLLESRRPQAATPKLSEPNASPTDEATPDPSRGSDVKRVPEAPNITLGTDARNPEESVTWRLSTAGNPHLLVAGLPGMGKTTCLLNVCRQMVDAEISPIIFSYHEDIDEKLESSVESLRFVDFDGLGFNPLRVIDRANRMAHLDVAGAIRDIFNAVYPDLGDIQADRIRKAIRDSFTELGWGDSGSAADLEEPAFGRFVEILRADPKPDRSLRSLLARLDELEDYGFFASGDSNESIWDSGRATVVRIHTTQSENLQRAFASLVFYGLYKDMFRRGIQERITHAVVFDEAHRAGRLKLIPTMAKECRKYGIALVLASQEARDFHTSVFSAIANYLVLRLTETDAKALVRNVADSRQQRALVDRLKQIERYKAVYFQEGEVQPSRVNLVP